MLEGVLCLLAQNIKSFREEKGMSREQLAKLVSEKTGRVVTTDVIGTYERGNRGVSVETLAALADIFGVKTDVLLGRSTTLSNDVDDESDKQLEELTIAMMFRTKKLSPDEIRRMYGVIKAGWPQLFEKRSEDKS